MDHLAIMNPSWGLLPKIATGEKTIESRWYDERRQPWGSISIGDTVYFKNSGQPVSLRASVRRVLPFVELTPQKVAIILKTYGTGSGISSADLPRYYQRFKNKRYCLLIFLEDVEPAGPFAVSKRGFGAQTAWITVPSIERLRLPAARP